jgi:hypothetical protein
MLLIVVLVAVAILLSTKTVQAAIPSESLLAFGLMAGACLVLFQLGRLA